MRRPRLSRSLAALGVLAGAGLGALPGAAPAAAQTPAPSSAAAPAAGADSARQALYARARRLVADGQGAEGRALVDSLLAASAEGTDAYAEALWWRAALAADTQVTEGDLRRLVVEYALSARAPEALLRLGQLELARGDRARAVGYLDRLGREYPTSPLAAHGDFWKGRLLLEQNDAAGACAAFGAARRRLTAADVELRNQLEYYGGRCPADVATADTVRRDATGGRGAPAGTERNTAPGTPASASGAPAPAAPRAPRFSVQVAAYDTRDEADRAVQRLIQRGFMEVRVAGREAPYRVRIGRYSSRAVAGAAQRRVRAAGMKDAFVVEAEP